eukprot:10997748-Heterocapsa_arctica.AAC.1
MDCIRGAQLLLNGFPYVSSPTDVGGAPCRGDGPDVSLLCCDEELGEFRMQAQLERPDASSSPSAVASPALVRGFGE